MGENIKRDFSQKTSRVATKKLSDVDIKKIANQILVSDLVSDRINKPRRITNLEVKSILDNVDFKPKSHVFSVESIKNLSLSKSKREKEKDVSKSENQLVKDKLIEQIKELTESNIDPEIFDVLVQNELDRRLKASFGRIFIILAVLFTIASYSIVVLDAINEWNISQIAITALIIETPIQFIGILYIIARNLFPQSEVKNGKINNAQHTL